jgi:hypothetical protein
MHEIVDDEAAWGEAVDRIPEHREALEALGFRCLGLVGLRPDEEAGNFYAGEDEAMGERFRSGQATEVWGSPDERAIAVPASFAAGPVLTFLSADAEGRIVETTTRPKRAPILREPGPTPPPLWHRSSSARDGVDVALIDTRDVAALWSEHRRRAGDRPAPPHTLELAVAMLRELKDRGMARAVRAYMAGSAVLFVVHLARWTLFVVAIALLFFERTVAGAILAVVAIGSRWVVAAVSPRVHAAASGWAGQGSFSPSPIVVPAFRLRKWPRGLVPLIDPD